MVLAVRVLLYANRLELLRLDVDGLGLDAITFFQLLRRKRRVFQPG
jgi:hypothetical protein